MYKLYNSFHKPLQWRNLTNSKAQTHVVRQDGWMSNSHVITQHYWFKIGNPVSTVKRCGSVGRRLHRGNSRRFLPLRRPPSPGSVAERKVAGTVAPCIRAFAYSELRPHFPTSTGSLPCQKRNIKSNSVQRSGKTVKLFTVCVTTDQVISNTKIFRFWLS
jgi:hypothetical protein